MSEFSLKNINQTGMIITLSREIETLMTKLGATELGLHDKTDHLANKLPAECVKLLHYIAAVRNKNAHEIVDSEDDFDMEFFTESCELVMKELKTLLPEDEQKKLQIRSAIQVNLDNPADVDSSLSTELRLFLRVTAFIPLVNIIYFLFCFLRSVANAVVKLIGVIFFVTSMIIITGAILNRDNQTMYIGFILYGIVYLYGCVIAILERKEHIAFNKFAYIPFLNFGYFLYGSFRRIKLIRFIYSLLLIIAYLASFFMYFKYKKVELSAYLFVISYLLGILTAIFDKISQKKSKKDKNSTCKTEEI